MPEDFFGPALVLTALFVPAFGYLYSRSRDVRALLWFFSFVSALAGMLLLAPSGNLFLRILSAHWTLALGQAAMQICAAMILGSLSPLGFRIGRHRILYAYLYAVPLVLVELLYFGVLQGVLPAGAWAVLLPAVATLSLGVALVWSAQKGSIPVYISLSVNLIVGGFCLWQYAHQGMASALTLAEAGNFFVAALLIIAIFPRVSPGVLFSVFGFGAWAIEFLIASGAPLFATDMQQFFAHIVVMGKVVAAVGMILLSLEDELVFNQKARMREGRVRREMTAYGRLMLSRRRVEDFDRQGEEVCQAIITYSRFSQSILLLERNGRLYVAGAAGMDLAVARSLDEIVARIALNEFLNAETEPPIVADSQTLALALDRWMLPGDDWKRMNIADLLAVPLSGSAGLEGALLLAGMRSHGSVQEDPLRAEDLLPIEMLAARLLATRNQTQLFERLVDSEKFAGIGQLASNVTQQLNNPLTVILGYASLIESEAMLDERDRRGVQAILAEARRMRSTMEMLSRLSRSQSDHLSSVSIAELLCDLEQLFRAELLKRGINFKIEIAPDLPLALCSPQQVRQAVLHCLQYAMAAVESLDPADSSNQHTVRLEASAEGGQVQILIAHSGRAFQQPERAFDPFVPVRTSEQAAGLGLSLCATLLRDNHGRASAINLEQGGSAILLELGKA